MVYFYRLIISVISTSVNCWTVSTMILNCNTIFSVISLGFSSFGCSLVVVLVVSVAATDSEVEVVVVVVVFLEVELELDCS